MFLWHVGEKRCSVWRGSSSKKWNQIPPCSCSNVSRMHFVLHQNLPHQDEKPVTCISRGKGAARVSILINYKLKIKLLNHFFSFCSTSSSNTKSLEIPASFSWSFNKQHVVQALRTASRLPLVFGPRKFTTCGSVCAIYIWFKKKSFLIKML